MPWGPFGIGKWKGHRGVYCNVCGWPEYSMWVAPPALAPKDKG